MSIGKRIRELRLEASQSQPEFSSSIGIEQSYLSKLENEKCIPSNEMFRSILENCNVSLNEFMRPINVAEDKARLEQVPDIEMWLRQNNEKNFTKFKRFTYLCLILIIIGIALFYGGFTKKFSGERHYEYQSEGIVLDGEPKDFFENWQNQLLPNEIPNRQEIRAQIAKRKDRHIQLSKTYMGETFTIETESGTRSYSLKNQISIPQSINSWFELLGILVLSIGSVGIIADKKILKYSDAKLN